MNDPLGILLGIAYFVGTIGGLVTVLLRIITDRWWWQRSRPVQPDPRDGEPDGV